MKLLFVASLIALWPFGTALAQNEPNSGGVSQGGYMRRCLDIRQYDPDWYLYPACSVYDPSSDYGTYDYDDYYSYANHHNPEHRIFVRSGILK
jgi:hypothetical protein